MMLNVSVARSETRAEQGGFGGHNGAAKRGLAQGNLASLHVGALTESLHQPTLLLLMGSDKVAAHAAWFQMNALRRELAGLLLFRQTLLHVTFGTRAFFFANAAPKQGSRTLLP